MNQIIDQIINLLKEGITAIFRFVDLVWQWSFGQMFAIFQSNWQALPAWKIAVLAVAVVVLHPDDRRLHEFRGCGFRHLRIEAPPHARQRASARGFG